MRRAHITPEKPKPSEVIVTDLLDGLAESLKVRAREMCDDLRRVRVVSAGCFEIEPEPIERRTAAAERTEEKITEHVEKEPAAKPTRSRRPKKITETAEKIT